LNFLLVPINPVRRQPDLHRSFVSVLVTGASGGIGAEISRGFARAGAKVNYSRDKVAAEETVSNIKAMGVRVIAIQGDVSKVAEIENLFSEALKTFGKIDIVVANAGIELVETPVIAFTEEQFDRVFSIPGCANSCSTAVPWAGLPRSGTSPISPSSSPAIFRVLSPGSICSSTAGRRIESPLFVQQLR
jgi:NAD(P)-dependent dehydrogenase (short-subunit alcohol dehydrogenase family)